MLGGMIGGKIDRGETRYDDVYEAVSAEHESKRMPRFSSRRRRRQERLTGSAAATTTTSSRRRDSRLGRSGPMHGEHCVRGGLCQRLANATMARERSAQQQNDAVIAWLSALPARRRDARRRSLWGPAAGTTAGVEGEGAGAAWARAWAEERRSLAAIHADGQGPHGWSGVLRRRAPPGLAWR